ncbi:MAG TPA: hypothetical protein VK525_06625 [Candidatus Saccharimonadales bacterium]|nr:hypothetical protein [Candidatus Saccharimonadales bacterium]
MAVSRRGFLVGGQVLLASAALPTKFLGAVIGASFGPSKTANLLSLNMASFAALRNTSFAVRSGAKTVAWFTLLSVEDMNRKASAAPPMAVPPKPVKTAAPTTDTFALHFQSTGDTLEQGTYEVQHATLGQFSLFVVPSGISAYTAVISHFTSATQILPPKPVNPKGRLKSVITTNQL